MGTVQVCLASPITKDKPVEQMTINICGSLPEYLGLPETEAFFKQQAEDLMLALGCLPQGTRYQLLLLMLQDAKSLYYGA